MNHPPILDIRNLNVYFKTQKQLLHAVRDISLQLYQKEIIGIVGESGCGKSAFAKALIKLLPSHSTIISGEVNYIGNNLILLEDEKLRHIRGKEIGVIFQDPLTSLNPTMKIGHQIIEGYLLHNKHVKYKEGKEYAIHLLEMVGIPQASMRFEEYPHTFSGGMRQRAMIALALAAKPKIIIADEPTTALDVTIQAQILDLMHQIKEKTGTSFIFITHDLSVVAGYCDRVVVMYAGKAVECADVQELFAHPTHPYTQGLLQSIPRLDMKKEEALVPIEGYPPNLTQNLSGCAFYNRCKFATSKCKQETPILTNIADHHQVACWNHTYE